MIRYPDDMDANETRLDQAEYVPDIDGQELIDKLNHLLYHDLRWDGVLSVWDRYPHELVIEAMILKAAWSYSLGYPREAISDLIVMFSGKLIPYARYRKDNPPKGDWATSFGTSFDRVIGQFYKITCDWIIETSNKELLRD